MPLSPNARFDGTWDAPGGVSGRRAPPPSYYVDTSRAPPPRTNRTRRVPHPVLIGHERAQASRLGAVRSGGWARRSAPSPRSWSKRAGGRRGHGARLERPAVADHHVLHSNIEALDDGVGPAHNAHHSALAARAGPRLPEGQQAAGRGAEPDAVVVGVLRLEAVVEVLAVIARLEADGHEVADLGLGALRRRSVPSAAASEASAGSARGGAHTHTRMHMHTHLALCDHGILETLAVLELLEGRLAVGERGQRRRGLVRHI